MRRVLMAVIALGVVGSLAGGGAGTEALASVVNSGSGVVAIAFVSGLYTYRRLRARNNDEDSSQQ